MTDERHPAEPDSPDQLSKLAAAIGATARPPVEVPSDVDDAMREQIRSHFTAPHRAAPSRRRWRVTAAVAAAAATIAFAVWIAIPPSSSSSTIVADVDGSGRVDILDAFALARDLDEGVSLDHDVNGDGRCDQADVDVIARRAVALPAEVGS